MAGNKRATKGRRSGAEERLLVEAAQRDPARFATVYENYFELVYAYVVRRMHRRDEAEDLTAEVFHKALANLPRFKWRGAPFAAWLFRIASNMIADRRKRVAREGNVSLEESQQVAVTESGDKPPQPKVAIREGFRTVTPYLTVPNVHEEIEFVTKVFGAEGKVYGLGSAGGFHSEYKIGDSMLMIGGGGKGSNWQGSPTPGAVHLYVEDVDAVYERALQAGATSLMPTKDLEYGERGAAIEDVGGNRWYIATATGRNYIPEGVHNLMPYMNPKGALKMIEFLKQAFAANEIAVYQSPEGMVHHAKIGIGNSIIEMGEAHGQWQPRPMVFMLYVEDCDAWYARAMKAEGAISMGEPADRPYGGRVGVVKDPFDNVWYISTHIRDAVE